MGKISPVSAKYIVHANIQISGIVDKPDVIGAIFGQTEGLLGVDLELRELQRSGRIGRIEVRVDTKGGKSEGEIIIPSSLDKAETSIVGAALEVIQRIGPCTAKIKVMKIEDVRVSKRAFIIDRAKELLRNLMDTSMPDSQELADEVAYSVRVMEIKEYGKDRLPAGPSIEDSDEIIIVEGRADVLNLLKHGIKNAIGINGTSVPDTVIELCKKKIVTAFVDGDRGGDLIIKELVTRTEIDYVTRAPDGKEVEEITKKEIHKALRSRISVEQAKLEIGDEHRAREHQQIRREAPQQPMKRGPPPVNRQASVPAASRSVQAKQQAAGPTAAEKGKFGEMLENLIGTRGAYILDPGLSILGKVPFSELASTVKSLPGGIYAIVFDGIIDQEIVSVAERAGVKFLIAMDTKVQSAAKLTIITSDGL